MKSNSFHEIVDDLLQIQEAKGKSKQKKKKKKKAQ